MRLPPSWCAPGAPWPRGERSQSQLCSVAMTLALAHSSMMLRVPRKARLPIKEWVRCVGIFAASFQPREGISKNPRMAVQQSNGFLLPGNVERVLERGERCTIGRCESSAQHQPRVLPVSLKGRCGRCSESKSDKYSLQHMPSLPSDDEKRFCDASGRRAKKEATGRTRSLCRRIQRLTSRSGRGMLQPCEAPVCVPSQTWQRPCKSRPGL